MKAIILAGGLGTRLRPLTNNIPKALVPIHDKNITELVIEILKKFGVDEIILSVGYKADMIQDFFRDGAEHGVKISYVVEDKQLGTAAPLILMDKLDSTFIMLNGDNLFNLDFQKMLEMHKNSGGVATIALTQVEDTSKYGVVRMEGDKIVEFVEKPKLEDAPSNYISSGYYIFEPSIFDYVPSKDFVMLEKDIFPKLAAEGKLFGYKDKGQWFDSGTFELLDRIKNEWEF